MALEHVAGARESRTADVVFVHGLGGHYLRSWMSDAGGFWPAALAEDLPGVAVWSFAYEAAPSKWLGDAMWLEDRATNALDDFINELGSVPIVFVCHSMGGLLAKEIIRKAHTAPDQPAWGALLKRVRGVLFLATPHTGSPVADWADWLRVFVLPTEATTLLKENAPSLRALNEWYRANAPRLELKTYVYRENKPTKGVIVVPVGTADPGIADVRAIPVDEDHESICKPPDGRSQVYKGAVRFVTEALGLEPASRDDQRPFPVLEGADPVDGEGGEQHVRGSLDREQTSEDGTRRTGSASWQRIAGFVLGVAALVIVVAAAAGGFEVHDTMRFVVVVAAALTSALAFAAFGGDIALKLDTPVFKDQPVRVAATGGTAIFVAVLACGYLFYVDRGEVPQPDEPEQVVERREDDPIVEQQDEPREESGMSSTTVTEMNTTIGDIEAGGNVNIHTGMGDIRQ